MMRRVAVLSFLAFLAVGSEPAWATIVVPMTLEDMSRGCTAAIRGRVVTHRSQWDEAHRKIHSYTEIEVLETLVGASAAGTRMTVRTLGGVVGEIGMNVAGSARFVEGEEVVVFVRRDRLDEARFVVMGMSQGKFRVDRQGPVPMAVRETGGLAFAKPSAEGRLTVEERQAESQLALDQLRTRVRSARTTPLPSPSVPVGPNPPAVPPSPTTPQSPAVPQAPAASGS